MSLEKPSQEVKAPELYQGSTFHDNTRQAIIRTTEDKLRNYLTEFCQHASVRGAWLAPFGILLAVATTFATTSFITRWGLSADSWAAIFAILGAASLGWLLLSLVRIGLYWKKGDMETVLKKIKNGGDDN